MANFPLPSSGLPISMSMLRDFAPQAGTDLSELSNVFDTITGSVVLSAPFSMSFFEGKTIYHFNVSTGSGIGVVQYQSPFSSSLQVNITGSEHNIDSEVDPNVILFASGTHLSGVGYRLV